MRPSTFDYYISLFLQLYFHFMPYSNFNMPLSLAILFYVTFINQQHMRVLATWLRPIKTSKTLLSSYLLSVILFYIIVNFSELQQNNCISSFLHAFMFYIIYQLLLRFISNTSFSISFSKTCQIQHCFNLQSHTIWWICCTTAYSSSLHQKRVEIANLVCCR